MARDFLRDGSSIRHPAAREGDEAAADDRPGNGVTGGGEVFHGTATRHFALEHPASKGHFPGNPIIPGAVLLREIVAAVSGGDCREIRSAKFHHPVRPDDTLLMSWTRTTAGEVRFSCSVAGSDRVAVTGVLRLSPA